MDGIKRTKKKVTHQPRIQEQSDVSSDPLLESFSSTTKGTGKGLFNVLTSFSIVKMGLMSGVFIGLGTLFFFGGAFGETKFNLTLIGNSDLENGLLAHWTFDGEDVVGTTATNRAGGGNNGTLTSFDTATTTVGRIGQALEFDGSDDYVAGTGLANIGTDADATLAAWVRPNTLSGKDAVFVKGLSGGCFNYGMILNAGVLNARNTSNDFSLTGTVTANEWQHIAIVFDGANGAEGFINGQSVGTNVSGNTRTCSTLTWTIGRRAQTSATEFFDGAIDDVRVYHRALSDAEIARMYELGATTKFNTTLNTNPSLQNGLIAHWTLDGKDFDKSSTTGEIIDRSGNNTTRGDLDTGVATASSTILFVGSDSALGESLTMDIGTPDNDRLVVILTGDEGTGISLTDVTVDSNSCNLVTRADNTNGNGNESEMWYCDEDDLGSSSGSVTIAITGGNTGFATHAHLYTGVSQSGFTDSGIDDTPVQEDDTATITGINVPAGGLVVMSAGTGNDSRTVDSWTSPLTERQEGTDPDSATLANASGTEASEQTNKSYTATWDSVFIGRGSAVLGVWPASDAPVIGGDPRPGRIAQAIEFDGTDDYINMGIGTTVDSLTNDFSAAVWVKLDTVSGNQRIMSHARANTANGWAFGTSGSNLLFTTYGVKDYTTSGIGLGVGEWHHLVAVLDSDNDVTFYVDGAVAQVVTHTTPATANTDDIFQIGAATTNGAATLASFVDGLIDDVRVYDRSLSAAEVKRLYEVGATTKINTSVNTNSSLESGLMGHWTFDGRDLVNNAVDRSGNASTGFLDGFTSTTTAPGRIGQGLDFDGSTNYVSLDSHTVRGLSRFSIAVWFKADVVDDHIIYEEFINGSGAHRVEFHSESTGELHFKGRASDSDPSVTTWANTSGLGLDANTWYHAVAVFDSVTDVHKIYVDGAEIQSSSVVVSAIEDTAPNEAPSLSDRSSATSRWDGVLDDVRFYNRVLSAAEVQRLYELGK